MNTSITGSSDEASRGTEDAPPSSRDTNSASPVISDHGHGDADQPSGSSSPTSVLESDAMKRATAKKLIERYFYQLIDGCGNPQCSNPHCASNGEIKNLTPNQAAAQAIQLFSQEAELCDVHPSKVARTQVSMESTDKVDSSSVNLPLRACTSDPGGSQSEALMLSEEVSLPVQLIMEMELDKPTITHSHSCSVIPKSSPSPSDTSYYIDGDVPYLNESKMIAILEHCRVAENGSYLLLIRTIGKVFSDPEALGRSFLKATPCSPIEALLDKAPGDLTNLKKEDFRTFEGDLDKDVDSCARSDASTLPHSNAVPVLDFESLRRAFKALFDIPDPNVFASALVNALITLSENIELDLRVFGAKKNINDVIRVFLIVFEIPVLGSAEYLELAMPAICHAIAHCPVSAQATLARMWAEHCKAHLRSMVESLQQLVTLKVISGNFSRDFCVQDDNTITSATKVMKVVYYANMLAGDMDSPDLRTEEPVTLQEDSIMSAYGNGKIPKPTVTEDPLGIDLEVNIMDSRKPLLPFEDFYNEPLSDVIEMDKDFAYYKSVGDYKSAAKFSFMNYSFILTPATKTLGLYYDNRIRMYSERRMSFFQTVVGQPTNPYLRLKVRRDHIIDDALVELEMVAMENPKDLKKQLVVEFEGEQGIDEGGVSKEFFQLIVEEIFNPDYGMFCTQADTSTVWFNPTSFESDAQFTLIGIVLGLAIYNNIILAVNFPMVVYRKLMGIRGSFPDLLDWNPTLYSGLREMLSYKGHDMEDTFVQTFRICHQDVYGNSLFHELKENGDLVYVNQDNKQEFVELYADFLLNKSVEKQFRAFRRGFHMVTDESPMQLLFRPEEVELLVCGSKNLDFNELEQATEYEGGYTNDTRTITDFWSVVHSFDMESKRKLLQFTTGSDRIPVGGLGKLKLIIARNGPDSDRLPTSHTCFNVLLLPEYSTKEKLTDRLVKAISYSKGFGML